MNSDLRMAYTLFDSVQVPILVLKGPRREIAWANGAARGVFGKQATLGPSTLANVFDEESCRRLCLAEPADDPQEPCPVRLKSPGSESFAARLRSHPSHSDELIVTLTPLAEPTDAPIRSDEELRRAAESLPVAALIFSAQSWRVKFANRAYLDLVADRKDIVIGAKVTDYIEEPDRATHRMEARLDGDASQDTEYTYVTTSGERRAWLRTGRLVDFGGELCMFTTVVDVTERRQTEAALLRSQQEFEQLVNTVPEAIIVHCDGKVVFANPVAYRLTGASPGALIGMPAVELVHADDRDVVRERMRGVVAEGRHMPPLRERILRIDGTTVVVETSAAPTDFEGKPAALIVARDVSEHIKHEQRILESEFKYRTLVENVNDIIFQLDAEGRFVFFSANRETTRINVPPDVIGRPFVDFVHLDDTEAVRGAFEKALQGELVPPVEFRVLNDEDEWRFLRASSRMIRDANGNPNGVIGIIFDLTDQIAQERLLRENERKLLEAQRIARISSWEWDPLTDRARMSGDMLRGVERRALQSVRTGQDFLAVVHPDDRARVDATFVDAAAREHDIESEFRLVLPSGGVRIVHIIAKFEPATATTAARIRGAMQDVTEQRRQELERRNMEARMLGAQRMESLGTLAGGVAHDFNNLLTGILGYAELLKMTLSDSGRDVQYLNEVEKLSQRAANLTRQLLAYSGRGNFQIRPIDIADSFSGFTALLQAAIRSCSTLTIALASELPRALADVSQLKQAVMNAVLNADESLGKEGGTIRLGTFYHEQEFDALRAPNYPLPPKAGSYVCVRVVDTGSGMSADELARACEPFYSTKFVGRGLGLSAMLGILRSHEGGLEICSLPDEGTSLTMYWPVEGSYAMARGDSDSSRGTVLVVDDEDSIRELLEAVLLGEGFDVLTARSGEECVDIFASRGASIDLVVLDFNMPGMGGEKTYAALRELSPSVPVVMCSGDDAGAIIRAFPEDAPEVVLQKPFSPRRLLSAVIDVLGVSVA